MEGKYRLVGLDISRLDNMWLENDILYLLKGIGEHAGDIKAAHHESVIALSKEGRLTDPVRDWPGRMETVKPPSHLRKDNGIFRLSTRVGFEPGKGIQAVLCDEIHNSTDGFTHQVIVSSWNSTRLLMCNDEQAAWLATWFRPVGYSAKLNKANGKWVIKDER